MDKVVCPFCSKELSSKRNRRLHVNICKRNPQRHRIAFLCPTCPAWRGYSEQARTEHFKSKLHRAHAPHASHASYAPHTASSANPLPPHASPLAPPALAIAHTHFARLPPPTTDYVPRPFNYLDVVLAPPLQSDSESESESEKQQQQQQQQQQGNASDRPADAAAAAHCLLTLSNPTGLLPHPFV